jgi:hypothetical protein
MANSTLIGAIRAEATLEGGKFVSGAASLAFRRKSWNPVYPSSTFLWARPS